MVSKGGKFEVYKDKCFRGEDLKRPSFQRLLKDIEIGKISKISTYKLDM